MAPLTFAHVLLICACRPARPLARSLDRRAVLRAGAGFAAGAATSHPAWPAAAVPTLDGYEPLSAETAASAGRAYFPPLTPPLFSRATYRYELGRDAWALEQLLTFANVSATVRTVVVRMADGGLWVDGPQWPTGEYMRLLDELGPVRHVVLPCVALEHKAPMKAFCKKYPGASVWVAPGQYGPFGSCGLDIASAKMGYRVDGVLPIGDPADSTAPKPPWADEFDYRTLYVSLPENAGPVSETAFLHKPTRTLVTTDAVVWVPDAPPPIFRTYFSDADLASPDFWPKTVLQAVFLPLRQAEGERRNLGAALGAEADARWPGYAAVRGRVLRAPILRAFADARAPDEVRSWVRSIASMGKFDRILTAHFASPIRAAPADFAGAFGYLDGVQADIACEDWSLLDGLNGVIEQNKLGAPVVYDFKKGCRPISSASITS